MRVFFEEGRGGQESILSLRGLADFGDFGWRDHWSVIAESVPHVGQDSSNFFVVELPRGWQGKRIEPLSSAGRVEGTKGESILRI